jgi:hypothetical protein
LSSVTSRSAVVVAASAIVFAITHLPAAIALLFLLAIAAALLLLLLLARVRLLARLLLLLLAGVLLLLLPGVLLAFVPVLVGHGSLLSIRDGAVDSSTLGRDDYPVR